MPFFSPKLKYDAYQRIGANDTVLSWILNGIPIPFKDIPNHCYYQNRITSAKQEKFVTAEIDKLVQAGTIAQVNTKPHCILAIQCVPKKNGKLRLVVDSRPVNQYIKTPKFNQDGISTVAELIQPDDDLASIDLKDGFHHVPILEDHQKYFGIKWNGHYYVWRFFPFGVSCAPYFFYKILRPVVQFLRQNNIRLSSFVDDFLLMMRTLVATDQVEFTINTFKECGWLLNYEKCELELSKQKSFVGFEVSTNCKVGPWVKILPVKIRKLRRSIVKCLRSDILTARQLAKVIGQCVAMTRAVIPAKLLLRNSYRVLAGKEHWDSLVKLTEGARRDLEWWLNALHDWNGAPLTPRSIDVQLVTDASGWGWGAAVGSCEAAGRWTGQVLHQHSNFRELLAVYQALQAFQEKIKGKHVQILSDNVTTVAYINHMGGSTQELSDLMTTIWNFAQNLGVTLTSKHLAGVKNIQADRLSRIITLYDWQLSRRVFQHLDVLWGPHTIDRFAAEHNTMLPRFNSMYAEPNSEAIDALAQQNWKDEMNWVNPPFWLIPKILRLVSAQEAEVTLIAPVWKTQPWYRTLKQMLVAPLFRIKNPSKVIGNYLTVPEPLKNPKWRICAWRISGKKS